MCAFKSCKKKKVLEKGRISLNYCWILLEYNVVGCFYIFEINWWVLYLAICWTGRYGRWRRRGWKDVQLFSIPHAAEIFQSQDWCGKWSCHWSLLCLIGISCSSLSIMKCLIYIELHLTSKSEILVIIIVKTPSGKMSTYATPEDVSILWNTEF